MQLKGEIKNVAKKETPLAFRKKSINNASQEEVLIYFAFLML